MSIGECRPPVAGDGVVIHNYTTTFEGSSITFACRDGLFPNVTITATCTGEGHWSIDPAIYMCINTTCATTSFATTTSSSATSSSSATCSSATTSSTNTGTMANNYYIGCKNWGGGGALGACAPPIFLVTNTHKYYCSAPPLQSDKMNFAGRLVERFKQPLKVS